MADATEATDGPDTRTLGLMCPSCAEFVDILAHPDLCPTCEHLWTGVDLAPLH